MRTLDVPPRERLKFEKIVTCSDLMLRVFDQASRAAAADASVLVTGESGTGKELIVEAIHLNSRRREGPFVVVNMAAVPEALIESELFGHVSGAFTGASESRVGRFEAADGGTLFIDEIGDLALESQAKLLRVLENSDVTPVGSNDGTKVDVRVIAATNRDLSQMIADGEFREDLYYRLNVVSIALPPLRERPEDIGPLVDHFLRVLSESSGRARPSPSGDLMNFLQSCDWPGNIRQLRNCVESMFVLADSDTLTVDDLPATVTNRKPQRNDVALQISRDFTLEDVEKLAILHTLDRYRGNRVRAARSLGISIRTLQRRLKKWENGNGRSVARTRSM
jgi:transcriptional regulator with PAS, ATPase and Fis domain